VAGLRCVETNWASLSLGFDVVANWRIPELFAQLPISMEWDGSSGHACGWAWLMLGDMGNVYLACVA
jgi:hypothetical protein